MYSRYKFFVRYVICKCFFLFFALFFHSTVSSKKQKSLMKSNLVTFSYGLCF